MVYYKVTKEDGVEVVGKAATNMAAARKARSKYGSKIKFKHITAKESILFDLSKQRRTYHLTSYPQFSRQLLHQAFEDIGMFEKKHDNCYVLR